MLIVNSLVCQHLECIAKAPLARGINITVKDSDELLFGINPISSGKHAAPVVSTFIHRYNAAAFHGGYAKAKPELVGAGSNRHISYLVHSHHTNRIAAKQSLAIINTAIQHHLQEDRIVVGGRRQSS